MHVLGSMRKEKDWNRLAQTVFTVEMGETKQNEISLTFSSRK